MDKLSIYFRGDKTAFAPGETVHGAVQWSLQTQPRALELSLFWYTAGKGTRDVGVVETLTIDERRVVLQELKDIMAVYGEEGCSLVVDT